MSISFWSRNIARTAARGDRHLAPHQPHQQTGTQRTSVHTEPKRPGLSPRQPNPRLWWRTGIPGRSIEPGRFPQKTRPRVSGTGTDQRNQTNLCTSTGLVSSHNRSSTKDPLTQLVECQIPMRNTAHREHPGGRPFKSGRDRFGLLFAHLGQPRAFSTCSQSFVGIGGELGALESVLCRASVGEGIRRVSLVGAWRQMSTCRVVR